MEWHGTATGLDAYGFRDHLSLDGFSQNLLVSQQYFSLKTNQHLSPWPRNRPGHRFTASTISSVRTRHGTRSAESFLAKKLRHFATGDPHPTPVVGCRCGPRCWHMGSRPTDALGHAREEVPAWVLAVEGKNGSREEKQDEQHEPGRVGFVVHEPPCRVILNVIHWTVGHLLFSYYLITWPFKQAKQPFKRGKRLIKWK